METLTTALGRGTAWREYRYRLSHTPVRQDVDFEERPRLSQPWTVVDAVGGSQRETGLDSRVCKLVVPKRRYSRKGSREREPEKRRWIAAEMEISRGREKRVAFYGNRSPASARYAALKSLKSPRLELVLSLLHLPPGSAIPHTHLARKAVNKPRTPSSWPLQSPQQQCPVQQLSPSPTQNPVNPSRGTLTRTQRMAAPFSP